MSRHVRKRSQKLGLPPGTLVPSEERKEPVRIQVFDITPDAVEEHTLHSVEDAFGYRDTDSVTWINVFGVHDVAIIKTLGEHYGLHPLVQEDIASTTQRPKVEIFDDYVFIVLKMIRYDPGKRLLDDEQISIILGPRYVISFQEREGDVLDPIRHRLRSGQGRLRRNGPDYLAYALLDVIVDHYFVVLEAVGEEIESLEQDILQDPSMENQQRIRDLRRELLLMRRSVWPVRELLQILERTDSPLIREETRPFLRDAYDHIIQVIDIVESLREVLGGLMDLYLSSLSNRMNEVMKFLTIIGTIFIPLTFIAGVYGMNFDYMPELHFKYGYPIALAVMLAIGLTLVMYFRRKNWL